MLTISKALSASQAQTYHAREFVSPEQNYWSQGDPNVGQWHGRLADTFELTGPVSEEHFARLADGQHPLTQEQLIQHRAVQQYETATGKTVAPVEHRAGWDATFSTPKSVSLTALVGGDNRVRGAHRQAVSLALDELERYTQARMGGNRPAQTTGQFVAAKFEHDTARPVDGYAAPQLHTHAVVFNMTQLEDGTHRALQPQGLFESQQFATAVYQSELTYRLRSLGYEIEAGRSGAPEIKGYTQEYLDASSPRSQQIRDYLERNGFQGHESAQIAAHSTRDGKEIHTPREVLAAHRKLAADFGHQADAVVAQARSRSQEQCVERGLDASNKAAHEAVTFARERSFEREAVMDERALYRDSLRRGMGETTYPEIRKDFERRVAAAFRKGRDFAAWLGIVPRQYSTGGKARLLGISKRGNVYLRKILIHGARAAVLRIKRDRAFMGAWLDALDSRAPKNVVVVAMANKLARIAWAVLSSGNEYRPSVAPA